MVRQLVIGLGEIGTAIRKILECDGHDSYKNIIAKGEYKIIHICIPYSSSFNTTVEEYKEQFKSDLIIIHSTVPIGTCELLNAVSSPCRGVHPQLEEGIRTFVKFFGGKRAREASYLFEVKRIKVECCDDSRTVEALKLWDTTIYGFNIILEKEIYKFCQENNLDFNTVYTKSNVTYNEGYAQLGKPQFKKYVLKHHEGPIGGHCVVNNCELLDSWVADLIKEKNELWKSF